MSKEKRPRRITLYPARPWVQFVSMQTAWIFFFITCVSPYTLALGMEQARLKNETEKKNRIQENTVPVSAVTAHADSPEPAVSFRGLNEKIKNLEKLISEGTQETASARTDVEIALGSVITGLSAERAELESSGAGQVILQRHDNFVNKIQLKVNTFLTEADMTASQKTGTAVLKNSVKQVSGSVYQHRRSGVVRPKMKFRNLSTLSRSLSLNETADSYMRGATSTTTIYSIVDNISAPQASGPPVQEDYDPTPEAPVTPAITTLAESLDNHPVKILEYVKNNYRYEPYYGLIKGSLETIREKGGNDMDLACVTISLLRAAGIPCRMVYGTIRLPIEAAVEMIGVEDPLMASSVFTKNGIPCETVLSGGKVKELKIDHVWVIAYLNVHPYMGGADYSSGNSKTWVGLDPSVKTSSYSLHRDVASEIGFDAETFLADIKNLSTVNDPESWVSGLPEDMIIDHLTDQGENVASYLDANELTIDNVYRVPSINTENFGILRLSEIYRVDAVAGTYSAPPAEFRHRLTLRLTDATGAEPISLDTSSAELLGKRITLSYRPATPDDENIIQQNSGETDFPAYLVNLVPQLKIDGQTVVEGTEIGMGNKQNLIIEFTDPKGESEIVDHDTLAGGYYAVGLNAQNIDISLVNERKDQLKTVNEAMGLNQPVDIDDVIGETLNIALLNYFYQVDKLNKLTAGALEVIHGRRLSEAFASYDLAVEEVLDVPVTARAESIKIDVKRDIFVPVSVKGSTAAENQFMITSAMLGSAIEHIGLTQMFAASSVSTVRIIQAAARQNVPVHTVDSGNEAAILPFLSGLSDSTMEEIQNYINSGAVVTVPRTQIAYGPWTGSAYIALDPDTGASSYMLEKGINGGESVVDFLKAGQLLIMDTQTPYQDFIAPALDWMKALESSIEPMGRSFIPAIAGLNRWFRNSVDLDKVSTVAACIAVSGPISKISGEPAILNLVTGDDYISPDNDGVKDTFTIRADVTKGALWTVDFRNSQGQTVHTVTGSASELDVSFSESVPDGSYTFLINAATADSQASPVSGSFRVDTTAPSAEITEPADAAEIIGNLVIKGTGDDFNFEKYSLKLEKKVGGPLIVDVIDSGENVVSGTLGVVDSTVLENGQYDILLSVEDKAGNKIELTRLVNINNPAPDITPPAVTMTAINTDSGQVITEGSAVSSDAGTIDITVNASDDRNVSKIILYLDDIPVMENTGQTTLVRQIGTASMSRGAHTVTAKAYDDADNEGVSALSFILDNSIYDFDVNPAIATIQQLTVTVTAGLENSAAWTLSFSGPSVIPDITGSGTTVSGQFDASAYTDGEYTVTLTVDNIANQPSRSFTIDVQENPPTAVIANISENQIIRDGLFDLQGTADDVDPTDSVAYRVKLLDKDGSTVADVTPAPVNAQGLHEGRIQNGSLGILDFTMIRNGTYTLKLEVTGGAQTVSVEVEFALCSELKVGQFSFSQQDMIIPVGGQPLTVIRTYNSFNSGIAREFGNGWTYSIRDIEMDINEQRYTETDVFGQSFSQRSGGGRNVDVTLPDGRRTSFVFSLTPTPNFYYLAEWKAAPGVYATLTPTVSSKLITLYGGLIYWEAAGMSTPYEYYDFPAFVLTMKDGTQYLLEREDLGEHEILDEYGGSYYVHAYGEGTLKRIEQRTGDRIEFSGDRIEHFNPQGQKTRSVVFEKDVNGRIIAIHDPENLDVNGNPVGLANITYEYSADGNLIKVNKLRNRATSEYLTTEFLYEDPDRPHFITSIKDPRGLTPMISEYDDDGRLVATVDAFGNRIELTHNTAERSETVFDRSGNPTIHGYDSRGNVVSTTDALGNTTTRTYDENNNETGVTDPLGNTTSYTYDSQGNRTGVTDPLGNTTSYTYDGHGNQLTVTDAMGSTTANAYDGSGNLISTTNALGQTTNNFYDANGNLTSTTDANNTVVAIFGYDSNGNMTSTTDAADFTRTFTYDANGSQTGTSYIWENPANPGETRTVSTSTVYNDAGQVTLTIDPDGNESHTFYNSIDKPYRTVDKLGNETVPVYDDRGNVIETQYPDGTVSRTVFDDNGRTYVTQDRHKPGETANGNRNIYDAVGRTVRTERLANTVVGITVNGDSTKSEFISADSVISSTSSTYDKAGRVIKSTDAEGNITRYEYDKAGRTLAVIDALGNRTEYVYDQAGRQLSMKDALGREMTFEYDALGRRVRTNYADGTFTSVTYNNLGQKVAETDQSALTTTFEYDELGRLAKVIKPAVDNPEADPNNPSIPQSINPVYSYSYDKYGRLSTITDPKGRTTSFSYDALGRQLSRTLPMGQSESQQYNTLGQLERKTDFKGQITEFIYDTLGRLEYKNHYYPGSPNPDEQIQLTYDDLGRQHQIIEGRGTTQFTYDIEGRMTHIQSPEGSLNYEYDSVTGRKTKTRTANSEQTFGYDELGRLKTVTVIKRDGQTLTTPEVTTYDYTAVGSRDSVTLPNGVTAQYTYNTLNRLTQIAHFNSSDELLMGCEYTLAPNGRRIGVHEERLEDDSSYSTTDISYSYDKLNRLTGESSTSTVGDLNYTKAYSYDLAGNRLRKVSGSETIDYVYNNNDQLVTESSSVSGDTLYQYDANGSLIEKTGSKGIYQYTYNLQNRLATADINRVEGVRTVAVQSSYTYNQGGIRVRSESAQTVDGITSNINRIFLLDSGLTGYAQVFEELNAVGGVPVTSYTLGDDVISQSSVAGVRHFCMDGHGSNRLLTDSVGAITDRFDFDAYGIQVGQAPNVTSPGATNLLYSGEQFDPELQQQYLRARYYDQSNGTFNRLDPFNGNYSDPQSLHKYAYCHGNPVNGTDPSGRFTLIELTVSLTIILLLVAAHLGIQYVPSVPETNQNGIFTILQRNDINPQNVGISIEALNADQDGFEVRYQILGNTPQGGNIILAQAISGGGKFVHIDGDYATHTETEGGIPISEMTPRGGTTYSYYDSPGGGSGGDFTIEAAVIHRNNNQDDILGTVLFYFDQTNRKLTVPNAIQRTVDGYPAFVTYPLRNPTSHWDAAVIDWNSRAGSRVGR